MSMRLCVCVCVRVRVCISVWKQEAEQSLSNILAENVDKMQLTRKILDLKQVSPRQIVVGNNSLSLICLDFPIVLG